MSKKFVECASLGVKVGEKVAKQIDALVKDLPQECRIVKRFTAISKSEFAEGEMSDVSWVTTQGLDLDGDIIVAKGIDLSVYRENPIVLWNHDTGTPIGQCAWIKEEGEGIKAKTLYTKRPEAWDGEWKPQYVYELTKAGVVKGKSIGLIPTQIDEPDPEQKSMGIQRVISSGMMFEYSAVALPANPECVVEAISKGLNPKALDALGIQYKAPALVVPVVKKQPQKKPQPNHLDEIKKLSKRIEALTARYKT